jgi:hypothetical protein
MKNGTQKNLAGELHDIEEFEIDAPFTYQSQPTIFSAGRLCAVGELGEGVECKVELRASVAGLTDEARAAIVHEETVRYWRRLQERLFGTVLQCKYRIHHSGRLAADAGYSLPELPPVDSTPAVLAEPSVRASTKRSSKRSKKANSGPRRTTKRSTKATSSGPSKASKNAEE